MLDHSDWQQRAAAQGFITQALIDGQLRPAQSGATFASINPATNQLLAHVAACDAADVDAAVASARQAFEQGPWARMAPRERKQVLLRLAELILANRDLSRPTLLGVAAPNPWLWRMAVAMGLLLAAVLGMAWLRELMGMALAGAEGLWVAAGLLALCMVWLELVRLAGRQLVRNGPPLDAR